VRFKKEAKKHFSFERLKDFETFKNKDKLLEDKNDGPLNLTKCLE
jgi:hypothetical protein